jgi:hypothetical protein
VALVAGQNVVSALVSEERVVTGDAVVAHPAVEAGVVAQLDQWWTGKSVGTGGNDGGEFAIRLDPETLPLIRDVARARGERPTQMVRQWVLDRVDLEREIAVPGDPATGGETFLQKALEEITTESSRAASEAAYGALKDLVARLRDPGGKATLGPELETLLVEPMTDEERAFAQRVREEAQDPREESADESARR